MALSIVQSADFLEPVYSPFYYITNSSSATANDFKYVYDLYTINQSAFTVSSRIARVKLYPDNNGYGVFSPNRILESYVSYDFNPFLTGVTTCINSLSFYKVIFGEEYSVSGVTFSAVTSNSGNAEYHFNSATNYLVGDTIKIDKSYKNYNADYDGLQTIISLSASGRYVTTDKAFGITATESGECISRLTISTGLTQTGFTINFAKQYSEKSTDFDYEYFMNGSNPLAKFLRSTDNSEFTYLGEDVHLGSNDPYTLSGLYAFNNPITSVVILTFDSNDYLKGLFNITGLTFNNILRFDIGAGTYNLKNTNYYNGVTLTTEPIINSAITYYKINTLSGSTSASTWTTFYIDSSCGHNSIRLAWLNNRGSWDYQNFNMKSKKDTEVNKENVTRLLDWNYEIGDFYEDVIAVNAETVYTYTTDWLKQSEADIVEGLFTSPVVYYLDTTNENYYPFIITSKKWQTKTIDNDSLISYTITGKYSFKTNYQRN